MARPSGVLQWTAVLVSVAILALVILRRDPTIMPPDGSRSSASSVTAPVEQGDILWTPSHGSLALRVVSLHGDASLLQRLLASLAAADYLGDTVCLEVHVRNGAPTELMAMLKGYKWPNGALHLNTAPAQTSSLDMWMQAISSGSLSLTRPGSHGNHASATLPTRCQADAVIVLDDRQDVSTQYYRWAKVTMAAYGDSDDVFGLSLNRLTTNAADESPFRPVVNQPFLSFQPGGGSYVASARRWSAFLAWQKSSQGQDVELKELSTTSWYRAAIDAQRTARVFFSAWLAQYCQERQQYMLFSNPSNNAALSRGAGGTDGQGPSFFDVLTAAGADTPLVTGWSSQMATTPYELRHYNWKGAVVPVCGERSCTPGVACEDSRSGYTCRCLSGGADASRFCGLRAPTTLPVQVVSRGQAPELLGRLLRSLDTAHYGNSPNTVDLSVQFHIDETAQGFSSSKLQASLELAERWLWQHGLKRVLVQTVSKTDVDVAAVQIEVRQLAAAPIPGFILLTEDQEVSPQYHRSAQTMLDAYGLREDVFGISLNKLVHNAADNSRFDAGNWLPFLSQHPGGGTLVVSTVHWDAFVDWQASAASAPGVQPDIDTDLGDWDPESMPQQSRKYSLLSNAMARYIRQHKLYTVFSNPPGDATLARGWNQSPPRRLADLTAGDDVELVADWSSNLGLVPSLLEHYGFSGNILSVCDSVSCPVDVPCEDSPVGAVCLCQDRESCSSHVPAPPVDIITSGFAPQREMRRFSDYARSVSTAIAVHNDIIMLTASAGFIDFLMNWIISAERLGFTNFLVVAEDAELYHALDARYHDRVLLSDLVSLSDVEEPKERGDKVGFSYNSQKYNLLVGHRPRYISTLLSMGFNVLYTDTDTVWMESPWAYFRPGFDMYVQSDAEGPDSHPWHMLCTGFMYVPHALAPPDWAACWRSVQPCFLYWAGTCH